MKGIFQEMTKAPAKPHEERLRSVEPVTLPGTVATTRLPRPSETGVAHTVRRIQDCFQKGDKPGPEINWKKLESKFHFVR